MIASVTPNEILSTYPVFRVATQKKSTDNVELRQLRCANLTECLEFIRRIIGEKHLDTLEFFEVHQLHKDGNVTIMIESDKPWPKSVARTSFKEEYSTMPKPPVKEVRAAIIEALVEQKRQARLDIAGENIDRIIAEQRAEMDGNGPPKPPTTSIASDPEDEELGRPLFTHNRGVA